MTLDPDIKEYLYIRYILYIFIYKNFCEIEIGRNDQMKSRVALHNNNGNSWWQTGSHESLYKIQVTVGKSRAALRKTGNPQWQMGSHESLCKIQVIPDDEEKSQVALRNTGNPWWQTENREWSWKIQVTLMSVKRIHIIIRSITTLTLISKHVRFPWIKLLPLHKMQPHASVIFPFRSQLTIMLLLVGYVWPSRGISSFSILNILMYLVKLISS